MRNRSIKILIISLTGFFIYGCAKESTSPPTDYGYNYFPVSKDRSWLYQCEEITIDDFTGKTDTVHFLLKDSVVSIISANPSDTVYLIEQYKKGSDTSLWTYYRNYTITKNNSRIEMNDENTHYVKLAFPVSDMAEWDGNAYNTLGQQIYHCEIVSYHLNGTPVLSAKVIQQNDMNLIREDHAAEIYGKDFGLIEKQIRRIDKDIETQEITSGTIYTQKLVR